MRASSETDADVGDKAIDAVRVAAPELRCRVVGEGGNLGLTQRARIEFALAGGAINTDAIDNAGGVNCSDREVNVKILLGSVVAAGDMTIKQRDRLLAEMTDEVAALVLRDNDRQAEALSLAAAQARVDARRPRPLHPPPRARRAARPRARGAARRRDDRGAPRGRTGA